MIGRGDIPNRSGAMAAAGRVSVHAPAAAGGTVRPGTAPRGHFDTGELEFDEALLHAASALQMLSATGDGRKLFQIAAEFIAGRDAEGRGIAVIVASDTGLPRGQYRLLRRMVSTTSGRSLVESHDYEGDAPIMTGGIVGQLVRRRQAELIHDLEISSSDPLATDLEGLTECLVLPVYSMGRLAARYLVFREQWDITDVARVERAMLLAGFIETSIASVVSARDAAKLARELDVQMELIVRQQKHLLPRAHSEQPWHWAHAERLPPGLTVGFAYRPMIRAGGDYFQFFTLPGEKLMVVIADVCGHSADAAMVMSMIHAIARDDAAHNVGPGSMLTHINRRIQPLLMEGRFVTALSMEIDLKSRQLRFAAAGHPAARICRRGGIVMTLDQADGLPLGIEPDVRYADSVISLAPGDRVLAYTDGVTDTLSHSAEANRQAFNSTSTLDAHLQYLCHLAPADVCRELMSALEACEERSGTLDDITLVCVGCDPGEALPSP